MRPEIQVFLQLFLEFPVNCDILDFVDNSVWRAAARFRFSFFQAAISAFAGPKQPRTHSFRINHLQNAFSVSPFF
jgi:hypothetical protein